MKSRTRFLFLATAIAMVLAACTNNPYRPDETAGHTYFSSFGTAPTKLDPTSAYYVHEGRLIDQIYEPPFTYHYLKRPYELITLTAEHVPIPVYYDETGNPIEEADPPAEQVARAEYTIRIKKGIMFQDHPCFARNEAGDYTYRDVTVDDISDYEYPSEFAHQSTRELKAADYALQIRRLADPRLASPVFSTMARYILGLDALHETYKSMLEKERAKRKADAGPGYNQENDEKQNPLALDYFAPPAPGILVIDNYAFKITLKRKYPQILYWMCMHFFAPMPVEAIDFYTQPAMAAKQFSINRCPVGTGPYYLDVFRPNEVIVLASNPNYHDDYYPTEGATGDMAAGLLADAGKRLPFIERQVLRLERESIPAWNKFLQGYYDASGIASEVFDQAIQMRTGEDPNLTGIMKTKGIRLATDVDTTFWYTAFNMLDDVVGGSTPERVQLRQAISIALDYNEYLDIFANGRGVLAQGPLPPGIFGYRGGEQGTNPYVDTWDPVRQRHERKSIAEARRLMTLAGYPNGRAKANGQPLLLHYDHSAQGESFFRSYFDWVRERLDQIGIRLKDRGTDLSRYRQKRKEGNWQIASGGWLADYPDPENFLFLFYGPNGKVKSGGANATNYANDEYDRLFREMESMQNSPARQQLVDRMMRILQRDAPAVWQYHPVSFGLQHNWYGNVKPHQMSYNTMKYRKILPAERVKRQEEWNRPNYLSVVMLGVVLIAVIGPGVFASRRREKGSQ